MPKANAKKIKLALKRNSRGRQVSKLAVGLAVLIVASLLLSAGLHSFHKSALHFGDRKLTVEEATSDRAKAKGLGGRVYLPDNRGMLFVYDEDGKYCFWMKDMNFPIDILWLDESRRVIHIAAHVPPESYPSEICPPADARFVLEVRAGLSQESGVDVGSQL